MRRCYDQNAGWSSLVARWAHNPKVGGSNPPPATKPFKHLWALNMGCSFHFHRDFHKSYWNRLAQLEWKDVPCDSVFAAFNGGQGSVEFHQFTVPAIQRMDCWGATMETLTRNIPSPLLTEKKAACYLSRSCSSLRRDRRNGDANVFG